MYFKPSNFKNIEDYAWATNCEIAAVKIEIFLRAQFENARDIIFKVAAELSLDLKIRLARIMLFHAGIAADVVERIFKKLAKTETIFTDRDDHAIHMDNVLIITTLRDQIALLKTEITEIERSSAELKRNKTMLALELALREQAAPAQDLSPAEAENLLQTKLEIARKLLAERMPLKTIKKVLNIAHPEANNSANPNSAVTAVLRSQIAVLTSEIVELGRRGARLKRNKAVLEIEVDVRRHDKPDINLKPYESSMFIWTKLDIINLMLAEKVPVRKIRKAFELLHK